jgi:putative flippase GtrA
MDKPFSGKTFEQAIKYSVVGILNVAVGTGVFSFFAYILNVNYLIANAVSYAVGVIHSFLWNKFWTFKSKAGGRRELFWFVVIFLFSFGIQNLVLIFLKERLNFSKFWAYAAAMAVYPLISFFGNKYITFRFGSSSPENK